MPAILPKSWLHQTERFVICFRRTILLSHTAKKCFCKMNTVHILISKDISSCVLKSSEQYLGYQLAFILKTLHHWFVFYEYRFLLTHFSPVFQFYTRWKSQKTKGFLTFSGGIEMEHWAKMGKKILVILDLLLRRTLVNLCF